MASEKRLIDANALAEKVWNIQMYIFGVRNGKTLIKEFLEKYRDSVMKEIAVAPIVDAVVLPCKVGDTVYGQFENYGKKIHECKVSKSKVCQFRDGSLHYFLDVEFDIVDPYYKDGRLMHCGQQAVFGEDFGSWYRVYRTREEVERVLYPCEYCFCGAYRSCEGCSYGERKDND